MPFFGIIVRLAECLNPGPLYVRRRPCDSKYDSVIEEAFLIEANPEYAFVQFPNGRETTVSLRDIAYKPTDSVSINDGIENIINPSIPDITETLNESVPTIQNDSVPVQTGVENSNAKLPLHHSARTIKAPDKLNL